MGNRKYQKCPFSGLSINRKAQISVEYLFILGLALAIIVPGSMMFYSYSQESNDRLVAGQINQIGKNIINQAKEVETIGKNSWTTLEVTFPNAVISAYVVGDYELIIPYETKSGITEAVFFSDAKIQGVYNNNISQDFHTGFMKIRIESTGEYVLLQEKLS
ncbi:MAG: hypothetical protein ABIB43_06085 [archaeon]